VPSFKVFVDANVLYAMPLCDTVLRLAERDLFRLLLSDDVLHEATRNLVADERCTEENAERRGRNIRAAFEDCFVSDYRTLIDSMTCDPKDRHVLAAAVIGGADQIVTANVKDFTRASTDPYGVEVVSPDTFLQNVLDLYPQETIEEIIDQAASLRSPTHSVAEVLAALSRTVPNFAQNVMAALAAQHGGFGKLGAAVAAEMGLSALTTARSRRDRGELRDGMLFVDEVVAGFARNSGLGRLQALVERLEPFLASGRDGIAVLGALPPEPDVEALTQSGIGVAWVTRWNPEIEFAGCQLALRIAPWLF
jgi:predicted nucleic acid-binding protein